MAVPTSTVVRIDIAGSTYIRGVTSYRHDRVVRKCLVTGLTASGDNDPDEHDLLHRAAEAATTGNLFHHIVTDLPLQQVSARHFRKSVTKAWVDLIYARGRWGSLPQAANVIASARAKDMYTPVYRWSFDFNTNEPLFDPDTHMPDGPLYVIGPADTGRTGKDAYRSPRTYMWKRSAFEFFLPTFRSSSPVSAIDHLVGKTNDADFMIGGVNFVRNTLLLQAPDVDWTANRNGDWFEIDYRLIGLPIGFNVQHIFINDEFPFSGEWQTKNGPEFEQADFLPLLDIL